MPDDLPTAPHAEVRRAPAPAQGAQLMQRLAEVRPSTFDRTARTVEVTFTTGADVERYDWWEGRNYTERLIVSDEAVDLSRLNAGAPVLDTHSAYALRSVIGVVERAWIEGGEGRALIRLSDREEVAGIVRDVEAGIIRNISAGYWTIEQRITRDERTGKELREALRWLPGELSLVPVPADAGAQTRSAAGAVIPAPTITTRAADTAARNPEGPMPDLVNPAASEGAVTEEQRNADRLQVREAELERVRGITAAARALGIADAERDALINDGAVTLERAQQRMIEALAARNAANTPSPATVTITRDANDTALRGLGDALMHRARLLRDANGNVAALPEHARNYRGMSLRDMAAECITLRGGNVRGMTAAEIAQAALGNRPAMERAGIGLHSTSDFPHLLGTTARAALGRGYGSARRTFQAWASRRTLPDFKDFKVINLSGAPDLKEVAEAGEIEFGTLGEGAEAYRLFRAGRRVAITFQAIVNDDMDGFSRLPRMFGNAAARLESRTVYGILNSNPNMADGSALFSEAHVNVFGNGATGYSAGDGVLDITGLGKGRSVLRTQTEPNGDIIDLEPRFLLVPDELEGKALQQTSSAYVAALQSSINPFGGALTPIVEPRLASAVQWYLIADSDSVDTVEYAYLEGMEEPQVTSYVDQDTDGVIVKCTHNFGAKAIDWRGMARSTGT